MKSKIKAWFTLVELLVVISILSIISVVAYQNYSWATDKAIIWRKINDVATIEQSLIQYKSLKNFYPKVWEYNTTTNMWGYNTTPNATPSNTLQVVYSGNEIESIASANWGWKIMNKATPAAQIWAKWTISKDELTQQFLSTDLYDPEVWEIKLENWDKLIDSWIWRYVYWVYRKSSNWSSINQQWTSFNIAYTIKKEGTEDYMTKIVWDYSNEVCTTPAECPATLIGSWDNTLENWNEIDWNVNSSNWNQWIPYAVTDFAQ